MTGPRVIVAPDPAAAARVGAERIGSAIAHSPDLVLGVATGSTPIGLYRALAAFCAEQGIDASRIRAFALDEYLGLPAGHPESYREVLRRDLAGPLGLDPARIRVPDGGAADPDAAAAAYDTAIRDAGGIDLQILGIGRNGHIGFNEPGSPLDSRTRVIELSADTRNANARFFGSESKVPHAAITQGIGTILEARAIMLLAFGPDKAGAVAESLTPPSTPTLPASALQGHPDVTILLDEEAARRLAS